MHSFGSPWHQANYLIQTAKHQPSKLYRECRQEKGRSLQNRLIDLYLSECNYTLRNKNLFSGSHLLTKLVTKEKLNCLVVNLYPGNEGYSLMLKTRTGTETETLRLPYEESELLQYLDNEELPPILVDLLERSQAPIFYSGCVIVEVRDYRRSPSLASYDCHHVLLKPTTQSVICDVALISNDGQPWTVEDKLALEATLVLATSDPLCLDPSVEVSLVSNWFQHRKRRLGSSSLHKMARRHSQVAINRRRRFEHCAAPPYLRAHDFISRYRNKPSGQPALSLSLSKQVVDMWKQKKVPLSAPSAIDVNKYAVIIEKPEMTSDNTPTIVEERIMETERGSGKFTHVTILQRPTDEQYFGKLYVDRTGQEQGASCEFYLGSKTNVQRYLNQFTEIFTEEGRKPVKITHVIPGQPTVVKHTHGSLQNNKENGNEDSSVNDTSATQQKKQGSQSPAPAGDNSSVSEALPTTDDKSPAATEVDCTSPPALTQTSTPATSGLQTTVNLSSLGLPKNIGLHNLVSLAGMSVPQGIAVPISLTMVPASQSGVLVASCQNQAQEQTTSICTLTTATASTATTTSSPAVIVSSGIVNTASTVLTNTAGMLSVPLTSLSPQDLAAQLVASGLKGSSQGVRSPASLSLLQVSSSQQSIPLIGALPRHVTSTSLRNTAPTAGTAHSTSGSQHKPGSTNPSAATLTPVQQQFQLAIQKQIQQQIQSTSTNRQKNRKKSSSTIGKP